MRVIDLFAGVGGFRLGLEAAGHEVVWWNQWEPATKRVQHAYNCYVERFHAGEELDALHNTDIRKVPTDKVPAHDLLVGGFPCQDYSVASPLRHSNGLRGKKGALWWAINRILEDRDTPYVLLENVDRLLKSPKKKRGRDFAVLLSCLARLRYAVEWRIIKASDYGQPQRRRRIFMFAAKFGTDAAKHMRKHASRANYLTTLGFFAPEFPVIEPPTTPKQEKAPSSGFVGIDPRKTSNATKFQDFCNAGVMISGRVWTRQLESRTESPRPNLQDMLQRRTAARYYVPSNLVAAWRATKKRKDIRKKARGGYRYWYNEGAIPFPDRINEPARTLLTCEGQIGPSRTNHIIRDPWKKKSPVYRILTPMECERLMGFRPGHTAMLPRRWRYFTMGNAVMVRIVERLGNRLTRFIATPAAAYTRTPLANQRTRRPSTTGKETGRLEQFKPPVVLAPIPGIPMAQRVAPPRGKA